MRSKNIINNNNNSSNIYTCFCAHLVSLLHSRNIYESHQFEAHCSWYKIFSDGKHSNMKPYKTRSAHDRSTSSITHSWQRWLSTDSSISQLLFSNFLNNDTLRSYEYVYICSYDFLFQYYRWCHVFLLCFSVRRREFFFFLVVGSGEIINNNKK